MKQFLGLLLIIAVGNVAGIQYDGLKVKFGWSDTLEDIKYFFTIPRSITEAESEGWRRTERPKGPLEELSMYCPPGRIVCPLYDTAGFVAGLQIAIPIDSIDRDMKPEQYFVKWNAPAAEGEPPREYWTATQYYVSEDLLKAGAGPTSENGETLQDGGVWVNDFDGKLFKIPAREAELAATVFKKQNCIPNMGTHYYYNMTEQLDCDKFLPWFPLVTDGNVLGIGFQTFGETPTTSPNQTEWYEDVSRSRTAPLFTIPHAPKCLLDRTVDYGVLSIHIYYISNPWKVKCDTGDSIQPAPVMKCMARRGLHYANQIGVAIKKLISWIDTN